jgi:hypothetical protein
MDIQAIHNVLIILHATAATLSFFAGCFLMLSVRNPRRQAWFGLYWWSLVGMVVLLATAILVYWTEYSGIERILFPGLFVLGLYMLYRARSANGLLTSQPTDWKHPYVEHIGFTLISLFEGFIIVSGINSGLPVWLVGLVAILGVLVGRWSIAYTQRKVAQ